MWPVVKMVDCMKQIGLVPIYTRFREKHIALVNGDLLEKNVDQYVFSSFDGGYNPTEKSIWGAARKRYFGQDASYEPEVLWGQPQQVGDTSVVYFDTMEPFSQDYPLLSLNMRGADVSMNDELITEYDLKKSLFQLLFACRELSLVGKLGRVLGLPLLGTGEQELPIPTVAKLLKQFAEDALSTIECLDEIVICAFSDSDGDTLRREFKVLSNQSPLLELSNIPEWQTNTIRSLVADLEESKHALNGELKNYLDDVLVRFSQESLDKEGIAISSRSFLMQALDASKNEKRLMNKIDQLHTIGTPNVWASHMHLIRIIGNTAGHPNTAVRRVSPEDLISILMGLKEFIQAWPRIKESLLLPKS